jgi:hypothetical protein
VVLFKAGLHVPVIPLVEVVGRSGTADPEQYGPAEENEGVMFELIFIVRVVETAHWPGSGVNVYVVVVVLSIAGLHAPEIPFVDVVGRAGIVAPEQYGPTVLKVGTVFEFMNMVIVAVVAHCPAVGVKVYVVVVVLSIAGLHVPVIPFVEVVGSAGIVAAVQYDPAGVKVGVVCGVIVMDKVVVVAHCPAVGVKV